jgi:hypothetical protein
MIYNNKNKNSVRSELGDWVKGYSLENYKEDWSYCLGLSYKYYVNDKSWRKNIKSVYIDLKKKDKDIKGFIFNELDISLSKLHHHLIIKSNLEINNFKRIVLNNWSKRGLVDVMEYDGKRDYCYYISKHYNKTNKNVFDMLDNI